MCKSIGATPLIGQHSLEFLRLRDMYFLLSTTYCCLAVLAVKSELPRATPLPYIHPALGSASTRLISSLPSLASDHQVNGLWYRLRLKCLTVPAENGIVLSSNVRWIMFLGARGGVLLSGSRRWLTQMTPVQSMPRTTSCAVHQMCSLFWWSITCYLVKIQRPRASRRLVSSFQQIRKIPTRQGASGAARWPERHPPRPEDHDPTTHIDLKLHEFLYRVCLV